MDTIKVKINRIVDHSRVDGRGDRVAVFFQGCTLHCPGCQNRKLWNRDGGETWTVENLVDAILEASGDRREVTFTGGEPFQQPAALGQLVSILKRVYGFHIIVYSGYTLNEILSLTFPGRFYLLNILSSIDVLVDGRFVKALDDPFITYRGSRNQRVIDIPATLEAGDIVLLDWDNEIIIKPDGNILAAEGMAESLEDLGNINHTRMCGQIAGLP